MKAYFNGTLSNSDVHCGKIQTQDLEMTTDPGSQNMFSGETLIKFGTNIVYKIVYKYIYNGFDNFAGQVSEIIFTAVLGCSTNSVFGVRRCTLENVPLS